MNKKAFTLVELLGVIIILGMLALIIYPVLTKTIKNQEKKTFEQSMEGILESVRVDIYDDDSILPRYYYYDNGKLTLLSVNGEDRNETIKIDGKAKATGYILVDIHGNIILDYLCDKKYCGYNTEDNSKVVIIANDNTHSNIDKNAPILTLNGKEKITLKIGERYLEQGVTAKTKVGEDLSSYVETKIEKDGEEVSKVDTSIAGIYTITYSLTYQETTLKVERIVEVKDEKPTIIITEASPKYVKEQTVKIEVQASGDNKVNNFIYQMNGGREKTVTGTSTTIQLKETGEYQFTVEVTDSKGNKSTKQSGIYKIDTIAPTITIGEIPKVKVTEVGGYNPLEGVEITDNMKVVETTIEGSFTATVGTQTVTIVAKDEAGNTTRKERTIEVITAEGPILNLSTVRTSNWVKSLTVTATASSTENIQTFTYEVIKDGVSEGIQNGTISGNSGTVEISLTTSGIYQIKLVGTDIHGSSSSLTSGEYQIDYTVPTISNLTVSITDTTIRIKIHGNDMESGIGTYYFSNDSGKTYYSSISDTYTFTGLTVGTSYSISVYVVDQVSNSSSKTTQTVSTAVAKIDTAYYSTLESAVAAIPATNTEKTITLLKSVSEIVKIPANKKVRYVGGNYTLTGGFNNYGYLTIVSGTIIDSTAVPLRNREGATLVVAGGKVSSTGRQTIYNYGGNLLIQNGEVTMSGDISLSSVVINQGILTMTGGSIKTTNLQGGAIYVYAGQQIELKGGTIEADHTDTIYSLGTVTIAGSTIINHDSTRSSVAVGSGGSLTMTSGTVTNTTGVHYAIWVEDAGVAVKTGGTTSPYNYNVQE